MGLQRIFSATTAVVGLFISVDYGLCDEFRCRGRDLTGLTNITTGIQDRALWTLVYVIGIGLWTLHLSLLEGYVVTMPGVSRALIFLFWLPKTKTTRDLNKCHVALISAYL